MNELHRRTVKNERLNEAFWVRFVDLWQASKTTEEVAKALWRSPATVTAYASKLRHNGVKLKYRTHPSLTPSVIEKLQRVAQSKRQPPT